MKKRNLILTFLILIIIIILGGCSNDEVVVDAENNTEVVDVNNSTVEEVNIDSELLYKISELKRFIAHYDSIDDIDGLIEQVKNADGIDIYLDLNESAN